MIQLLVYDRKKNVNVIKNFADITKAEDYLNEIGPKPKVNEAISPKKKFILVGASWDTKAEKNLVKPFIFPDDKEEEI